MDQSGSTGGQSTPPPVGWAAPAPPANTGSEGFNFGDFLSFRYLITPAFVTVIYVLGAIFIILASVGALVSSAGIIGAVILFIFGQLYWRIILEFVMVLFRMNDSLHSIDRRGKGM